MGNSMESGHPAPSSGPPWIHPEVQKKITWRDGDIVISVPPKSGTTWTMNIVYQLLCGGKSDFRDIYEEVPWIEFRGGPSVTDEDILNRVDAMPMDCRRAFKTHSAPPVLPFLNEASGKDVKYIVVFRNPEEALASFRPFIEKHSDEWYDLWQMPPEAMARPDFATFYSEVIDPFGMHRNALFGFVRDWWPLRTEVNVLFMHYSDMKLDHESSIRKIAKFLGSHPSNKEWSKILEFTSFGWMKEHEDKFEGITLAEVPVLTRGAMIRRGEAGQSMSDGMTDDISRHLRSVGDRTFANSAALEWFYQGGECP